MLWRAVSLLVAGAVALFVASSVVALGTWGPNDGNGSGVWGRLVELPGPLLGFVASAGLIAGGLTFLVLDAASSRRHPS